MFRAKPVLAFVRQVVCIEILLKLDEDYLFGYFRNCWEYRNRAIVVYLFRVSFFEESNDFSNFLFIREYTCFKALIYYNSNRLT